MLCILLFVSKLAVEQSFNKNKTLKVRNIVVQVVMVSTLIELTSLITPNNKLIL